MGKVLVKKVGVLGAPEANGFRHYFPRAKRSLTKIGMT